ncbi:lysylphosphatidylglycerol synthase transmembrane domain-containing protein [Algoriphagus sp.]|uniref:lysylphosphatidylglycerol synthase transmembrane domain-containing protein n=1 Tax=Algoriphagus sp. TaxID=1872435 RepID=UPI00391BA136
MKNIKFKNLSKWLLKFGLSSIALFFVFKKVELNQIVEIALSANPFYLSLALLAFNSSKIISAFRLNQFYKAVEVNLTEKYNLSLYYLSMFYNLFLPGSIGGDAYKVYLLKQEGKGSLKKLSMATLLDRVSGLALLVFLSFFLVLVNQELQQFNYLIPFAIIGLLLTLPSYYLFTRLLFKSFYSKFWSTTHLSFWVQLGQLLCAYFILLAIGVESHYLDYLVLFMVSSVVAVLPFSIGGIGARELVFLYAHQYIAIDESQAISFTLLFFSTLASSSFLGLIFIVFPDKEKKNLFIPELLPNDEPLD